MQHYLGEISGGRAYLDEAERHHLLHVRRVEVGEQIEVGDGQEVYSCLVASLDPLEIRVLEKAERRELGAKVTLAFGLLKGEHNDLIVQKGTELGVSLFAPFLSDRVIVKPEAREDKRLLRLRKIAQESAKQCRRDSVPEVRPYQRFEDVLSLEADAKYFAYEAEAIHGSPLLGALRKAKGASVLFLIGPEGGFTEDEARRAIASGFQPVSLGKRILRAETAALYCASLASAIGEGKDE